MLIGMAIGVALLLLLVALVFLYFLRKALIRSLRDTNRALQKLADYGRNSDVVIIESKFGKFLQFKKYITSSECWGVDFVFPLIDASEETKHGAIDDDLVALCFDAVGLDFSHTLGFGDGTTLDFMRKKKILGDDGNVIDVSSRYRVEPCERA